LCVAIGEDSLQKWKKQNQNNTRRASGLLPSPRKSRRIFREILDKLLNVEGETGMKNRSEI
jgi:hypothetical protein